MTIRLGKIFHTSSNKARLKEGSLFVNVAVSNNTRQLFVVTRREVQRGCRGSVTLFVKNVCGTHEFNIDQLVGPILRAHTKDVEQNMNELTARGSVHESLSADTEQPSEVGEFEPIPAAVLENAQTNRRTWQAQLAEIAAESRAEAVHAAANGVLESMEAYSRAAEEEADNEENITEMLSAQTEQVELPVVTRQLGGPVVPESLVGLPVAADRPVPTLLAPAVRNELLHSILAMVRGPVSFAETEGFGDIEWTHDDFRYYPRR